jgi:type VI protein secretion system component VasK
MRYVCLLLRRIRRPRCGINGILTLLPFELSSAGPLHLSALAQSARGDVSIIQETLGIRSPLTAMLIGLEQDKGFNELVRRLQPELLSRRLGGRFDIRSRPTPEALNNHSDLLCDAFEDWVYRLFGSEEALAQQRGNRKLFELTCRIRHELKPRLRIVLGEAFGCEPEASADSSERDNAFFFSGCYFAASGTTTGQPAFVKGVLHDKLMAEQSQVEWTDAMLRVHHLFRVFAITGWIVAAVLASLLLIRWLVYR